MSCLLAAVDPRGQNPLERAERPQPVTLSQLLESFVDVVLPETTALLAAIAELGPDELTRAGQVPARQANPISPRARLAAGVPVTRWRQVAGDRG